MSEKDLMDGNSAEEAPKRHDGRLAALVQVASNVARSAGDSASEAIGTLADAAGNTAKDTYKAFGGSTGDMPEGSVRLADGSYQLPSPIISSRELTELDALTERYENLKKPGKLAETGKKLGSLLPSQLKDMAKAAGSTVTEQKLYEQVMEVVADGFKTVEEQAARFSVGPEYVIEQVNASSKEGQVANLSEICLLRATDVARAVEAQRSQHLGMAFAEGAVTGAPGFAGIPFNLALSTCLYFRAVQSIAMFYGYDVKGDASEMMIASEVFTNALNPSSAATGGMGLTIGRIMAAVEISAVKQTVKKGWTAMAEHGGATLLIAQMRALANAAARKAVQSAGKQGLEKSAFKSIFEQVGRKLTQNVVGKAVPIVGGAVGALFDTSQMNKILNFAEIFYEKRFILEKEERIAALTEGTTVEEQFRNEGVPVDAVIEDADESDVS